jgi:hypothetical protein
MDLLTCTATPKSRHAICNAFRLLLSLSSSSKKIFCAADCLPVSDQNSDGGRAGNLLDGSGDEICLRDEDRLALRAENGGGHAIVKEGFCSSCDDKLCAEASGDDKTAVVAHDGFEGGGGGKFIPGRSHSGTTVSILST